MIRLATTRLSAFEIKTKGAPYMKHLDLYARRDPQLAPYLLREVDIEFKRKCKKVNFCIWVGLCTFAICFNQRVSAETIHYMRSYAEFMQAEQECKDEDNATRRRVLVQIMNTVKHAYSRDGTWRASDAKDVDECLKKAIISASSTSTIPISANNTNTHAHLA